MPALSEIRVRPFNGGDEKQISNLLHDNFPNTFESEAILKTWQWQFKNNFVSSPSVVVAEIGSDIVAQYALMRLPFNYQGATIGGAISTATVTDKSFRGKGLFTRLAENLYETVEKDGCKIVFGFPNSQSIRGFIERLSWFEINPFPLHLKIVDSFPLVKKYLGAHKVARVVAAICSSTAKVVFRKCTNVRYEIKLTLPGVLPDGLDALLKESAASNRIGVVRDAKYLEWRYLEKPFYTYQIYTVSEHGHLCGYFIVYVTEKFGLRTVYVMECAVTSDNPSVHTAIFHKLENIARETKADSISMLLLPSHPCYRLFRKYGFIRVPSKFLPQKIFFAAKVLSKGLDVSYVKDPRNWYISWGDLDVV